MYKRQDRGATSRGKKEFSPGQGIFKVSGNFGQLMLVRELSDDFVVTINVCFFFAGILFEVLKNILA